MATPLIRTVAQVRAISGPTQHRLLSALERLGLCSVAELARATGLPAESIYYHIRRFERVGIVRRVGHRETTRHPESVFELNARSVEIDATNDTPAYRRAVAKMIASLLRMAARAYEAALDRGTARWSGRYRNANVHQLFVRIPKRHLADAHRLIDELFDDLRALDDDGVTDWTTVTLVACPVDG